MKVLPVEIKGIAYLGQSSVGSPLVLKSNKRYVLQNIQIITQKYRVHCSQDITEIKGRELLVDL